MTEIYGANGGQQDQPQSQQPNQQQYQQSYIQNPQGQVLQGHNPQGQALQGQVNTQAQSNSQVNPQTHVKQPNQISQPPSSKKRSARDYQFGTRIGEGSYSTVFSALDVHTNKTYAIKVLSKRHIVKEDKIKYVNIEKTTLHRLGQQHPGIVQLYYTFQDDSSLFFVLDFAEYGELLSIIRKFGSLSESVSRYYMCQIIDAVKFIHLKGVIHRDLKPENILVSHDFSLKITDFGAAKLLGSSDDNNDEKIDYNGVNETDMANNSDRKGSFVGTAEYVSPELLKHNLCGFEADVWALGCILYQFFYGVPPFKGSTEYLTFEKIINTEYSYKPQIPLPTHVTEIIDQILVSEPSQRLTIPQIMTSSWFQGVPWDDQAYIWHRKVPRFEPYSPNGTTMASPPSPYLPGIKNGSNRNMNKSSSYQQLHSQIKQSDFDLIPSLGAKKTHQPATKLKMTHMNNNTHSPIPQTSQTANAVNSPTKLQPAGYPNRPQQPHFSPSQSPQQQITQVQRQNSSSYTPQINPNMQNMNQSPNQAKPIPPSPGRPHNGNLRANTAFNHLSTGNNNVSSSQPNAQYYQASPTTNHFGNTFQPRKMSNGPRPTSLPPVAPSVAPVSIAPASAAAKAAALAGVSKAIAQSSVSEPSSISTQSSVSAQPKQSHSAPRLMKSPPLDSGKFTKAVNISSSSIELHNLKTSKPTKVSKEEEKNIIKFREISSLMQPNEKILKMDTILKLRLSNKLLQRSASDALDDVIIDQLIEKHLKDIKRSAVSVVAVITNLARVFFIDGLLNVLLVDLKANQGNDYLMYDYEFESVSFDEEETEGEDMFGYLILELIKEGGDLVFLKRISPMDQISITDKVKVVDRAGDEIKLGKNYGWIDCLLMAKDMVSRDTSKASSMPSPPPPNSKGDKKNPTMKKQSLRTPTTAKKTSKTTKPEPTGTDKKAMNKFAYAAAAAAHK